MVIVVDFAYRPWKGIFETRVYYSRGSEGCFQAVDIEVFDLHQEVEEHIARGILCASISPSDLKFIEILGQLFRTGSKAGKTGLSHLAAVMDGFVVDGFAQQW